MAADVSGNGRGYHGKKRMLKCLDSLVGVDVKFFE